MFFSFSTGASIFLVPGVKCFRFRDARSWPGYFEGGVGGSCGFSVGWRPGGGWRGVASVGGVLVLRAGLGAGL